MVLPEEAHEAARGSVRRLATSNVSSLIGQLRAEPSSAGTLREAWQRRVVSAGGVSSGGSGGHLPRGASPWVFSNDKVGARRTTPNAAGGDTARGRRVSVPKAAKEDAALLLVDLGGRGRFDGKEEVTRWTDAIVRAFSPKGRKVANWFQAVRYFNRCPLGDEKQELRCQSVC